MQLSKRTGRYGRSVVSVCKIIRSCRIDAEINAGAEDALLIGHLIVLRLADTVAERVRASIGIIMAIYAKPDGKGDENETFTRDELAVVCRVDMFLRAVDVSVRMV